MNKLFRTTAKRVLGQKRANRWYRFASRDLPFILALNMKSSILLRFASGKLDKLNRYEAKHCSQNGEDGIIAAILRRVGTTNKFCVEFGVGEGRECNTACLVRKGWSFLWMDALEGATEPIKGEYITAENINQLFRKYDVPMAFDLLSIDIDYNTYWVWRAIEGFSPRIAVIEYNASFLPTESVAVAYDPHGVWDGTNYFGASLLALTKLAAEKGYTLIACDNRGVNAFFVRNDLKDSFVLRGIDEIYRRPGYGKVVNRKHTGYPPSNKQFVPV
jgi:hypothetical protein